MEISTPRQLLRSLGHLPETSTQTPRTSEKSLQKLFQSRGWLEDSRTDVWYVFQALLVSMLCFSVETAKTSQTRTSFGRVQNVIFIPLPYHLIGSIGF